MARHRIVPRAAPLAVALAVLAASGPARAQSTIVVDAGTGAVLSQSDATLRRFPASTTKLMTTYVALEMVERGEAGLDTPIVMTRRAAEEPPSKMGYEPGSVMRLDNALRMIMVKSANDVSVAIAQGLAGGGVGSYAAFVERMNETAARLGMADTRFINANGLPGEGQHSSAKDLAILAMAIRRDFPAFGDLFSTEAIFTGTDTIRNHNDLLGRFEGADGMKTGYICASGFNVVSTATRGGRTLVAVVLGAPSVIQRARRTADILEAGFRAPPPAAPVLVSSLPPSGGPTIDTSQAICSDEGRTARANEQRGAEMTPDNPYGSPYIAADLGRAPVVVPVGLGGAAGTDAIEPGISLIAAYGIPIPTPRPAYPLAPEAPADAIGDAAALAPAEGANARVVAAEDALRSPGAAD